MIRYFLKNFIIFLSLFTIASCSYFKEEGPKKIRIVDLQGKAHEVRTRVPELNSQIIKSQGGRPQNDMSSAPSSMTAPEDIAQNRAPQNKAAMDPQATNNQASNDQSNVPDYGVTAPEPVKKTFQAENAADPVSDTLNAPKVTAGKIMQEKEIQYDLSDTKKSKKSAVKTVYHAPKKQESVKSESSAEGIFVQTGAFSNKSSADKSLNSMQKFSEGQIEEAESGNKILYRVLLGPFPSKVQATKVLGKIKKSGREAVIVRKN